MPQAAVWVAVGLLAVLVAAAVPVLIQLRRTLATAETTLQSTSRRVDAALDGLTETLDRVNKAAAELERGAQKMSSLFEVLGGLGDALGKVRSSVGTLAAIGASVGPMVIAAVRAAFRKRHERDDPVEVDG
jgi:uncharacterized protein YoxC